MDYVYISSGSFGAQVLQHLNPKPVLVITGIDKLGGRGMKELIQTPVKKLCIELNIPFVEVGNKEKLITVLRDVVARNEGDERRRGQQVTKQPHNAVCLSCDFGMIIPSEILHFNEYGIWNIHPSLLPKYRGTTPIQSALLNGEKVTGVTIMQMDEKIDHGPIIAQEQMEIDINDTNITLQGKLSALGAKTFSQAARKLEDERQRGRQVTMRPQDHFQATYTKKLTKEDGFVPLAELTPYLEPAFKKYNLMHLLPSEFEIRDARYTTALHNKIRALVPWPGVWTKTPNEKIVKIVESRLIQNENLVITTITIDGKTYKHP